jgi:probable rRNA maturation factor
VSSAGVNFLGKRPLRAEQKASLRQALLLLLADHACSASVNVCFVDDEEIRALNRDYLGHDYVTDVVTFPMRSERDGVEGDPLDDELLGEVVVSVDTARRYSEERGTAFPRELSLYAIHGTLHLLGYDDAAPADRRKMRRAEHRYLAALES